MILADYQYCNEDNNITKNTTVNFKYYGSNIKLFDIINLLLSIIIILERYPSKHTILILIIIIK